MGGRTSTSDSRRSEKESESQETPRRAAEPRSASFVDVFSTFPGERAGRAKTLKGRPGVLRVSSVKRSMPSALRHEPLHPRRLAGANEPPNPRESGESPRESRKNVHEIPSSCPQGCTRQNPGGTSGRIRNSRMHSGAPPNDALEKHPIKTTRRRQFPRLETHLDATKGASANARSSE